MVPTWSERLPCSSHSADQKIDHSRQQRAEADAGYAEVIVHEADRFYHTAPRPLYAQ